MARHPGADQLVGDVRHLPLCAVCARWLCVVVWVCVCSPAAKCASAMASASCNMRGEAEEKSGRKKGEGVKTTKMMPIRLYQAEEDLRVADGGAKHPWNALIEQLDTPEAAACSVQQRLHRPLHSRWAKTIARVRS